MPAEGVTASAGTTAEAETLPAQQLLTQRIRLPDGIDERLQPPGGLAAFVFFDPAADVHGERPHVAHDRGDRLRRQPAGGDDGGQAVEYSGLLGRPAGAPVVRVATAASLPGARRLQHESREVRQAERADRVAPRAQPRDER